MHDPCPICLSTGSRRRVAVLLRRQNVLACDECRGESVVPTPSSEELVHAYQDFEAGRLIRAEFDEYVRMARMCLSEDLNRLALHTGRKFGLGCAFLDYGCGGGHFVAAAQGLGMNALGYEVDRESVRLGAEKGIRITSNNPLVGPVQDQFDFIRSMHVIEHVPDPFLTLSRLVALLRPAGVLVLGVPDQGSIPATIKRCIRILGIKRAEWGFVQPPVHLHGFRSNTMHVIAAKLGLRLLYNNKTSPLRSNDFPSTERYWEGLGIHKVVYRVGLAFGSGGHLLAGFQKPA